MPPSLLMSGDVAGLRRAVGPTSWVVLEELLLASEPADGPGSTRLCVMPLRDLALRLGLDKDTVARAVQRLLDAGHVARSQPRTTTGVFACVTYIVRLPGGLALIDGVPAVTVQVTSAVPVTSTTSANPTLPAPTRARRPSQPTSQLSLLEL